MYDLGIDVLYKILIQSDLRTLKSMYIINRVTHDLCNKLYGEKYFWRDKFVHDELVIIEIPLTISTWFDEYEHSEYSKRTAEVMLRSFDNKTKGLMVGMERISNRKKLNLKFEYLYYQTIYSGLITFIFYDHIERLISILPPDLTRKINASVNLSFSHIELDLRLDNDKFDIIVYNMWGEWSGIIHYYPRLLCTYESNVNIDARSLLMSILYYFKPREIMM